MSGLGNKEVFARNLMRYVNQTGRSQKELAEIIGVAQPTFNEWCRGKKYPRIDKIEMLADFFGIQKSDLIEEKTDTNGTDLSAAKRKLIDLASACSEEDAERFLQMFELVLGRK